jgi:glycosyltransferase involved in cell wall biosynthesis
MTTGIGALVITRYEEHDLEDCLRSLAFCDERVVVDSFSTDRTVDIACAHSEHVYRRTFRDFADQKNWGLGRLSTPWALIVDADERVGEELAREIVESVRRDDHDGFWLFRRNRFFGRVVTGAGWQHDRVLRLFRREGAHHPSRLVHEEAHLPEGARIGTCRARLEHHSYSDWPSTFGRLLSYTTRGAAERAQRGRKGSAWRVGTKPLWRFLRQYLLQGGWRDGVHGYVLCTWSAIGVFVREAKLRAEETERPAAPSAEVCVEVVRGRPVDGDPIPPEGGRQR